MSVSLEGVSLHVADVERSVEFYSRIPGAEMLIHEPGTFARFRIGSSYLHVVHLPEEERNFHVEMGVDDLNQLYTELKTLGIEPEGPPTLRPWGMTDMNVSDPDGNILEFSEPHDEFNGPYDHKDSYVNKPATAAI